jgi:hypothetical protein
MNVQEKSLVVAQPQAIALIPSSHELTVYQVMAKNAAQSQLYKTLSEAQIMMIMLAARELGLPPMLALNGGICCIQGRVELSARLMAQMIRQRGHSMQIKVLNRQECVLQGRRCDNGDTMECGFTMQDAKDAGLTGKAVWKSYTEDMLYARALSRLARRLYADVIGTAYVEGEISGEVVSREPIVSQPVDENAEMMQFLSQFPEEDHEYVREYVAKYTAHFKRTVLECLDEGRKDMDKFQATFSKWKAKRIAEIEVTEKTA